MSREAFAQREHPLLVGAVDPQDAADMVAEVEAVARHRVVVATASPRLSLPPDWSDRFSRGDTLATRRRILKGSD